MEDMILCVCLTCGVRNNHSTDDGYCQNGHDDWLEYIDFKQVSKQGYTLFLVKTITSTPDIIYHTTPASMDQQVKTWRLMQVVPHNL